MSHKMFCSNCNKEMKVSNYAASTKINRETDAVETKTLEWYVCEDCGEERVSQFLTYEVTAKNRDTLKELFKIYGYRKINNNK